MKKMLSFSSWNLVGTFAFMLKGEALNILLNFFFGPLINAARAIAFQIGNAISSFSANITIAFKPQMVTSYSQGNNDRVNFLFFIQSKVCFALISILIVPVILNINYILRIWLGNDVPEHTSIFSVLVLIDSLVCSLNAPCTQVVFATGKIKGYQIASSCVNVLLLPFCWLFLYLGANAISTFIITIIISLLNQIFCVWQMSKVFDLNLYKYINNVIFPSLFFIVLCPIPGSLLYFIIESSIIRLFVITCISVITGLILTYFILFSKMERLQIKGILKRTV
jgi:O-antigen/teichoic acid export membrane protein